MRGLALDVMCDDRQSLAVPRRVSAQPGAMAHAVLPGPGRVLVPIDPCDAGG